MKWVPDRLLRLVLNGPAVIASLVIYLAVLTTLPEAVAKPVAVVLVVGVSLPASGRVETLVARVVTGARSASPDDLTIWARVEVLVEAADLDRGAVGRRRLFVRRSDHPWAAPIAHAGRTSVVVTPRVLQGLTTRQVTAAAVASEVAGGRVEHHFTAQRGAVRGWFMTLPVWAIATCLGPLLGRVRRWSVCRVAWHLRVVVGTVYVVDGVAHDRAGSGAAAGALVLLSYVAPAARREASRRAASQAEVVRSAVAPNCELHRSAPRHDHFAGLNQAPPGERSLPTDTLPHRDVLERPRLYLVRTE